jgi:hypothetical protein
VKKLKRKAREPTRINPPGRHENQVQVLKRQKRQEKQDIIEFLGVLGGSNIVLVFPPRPRRPLR